MVAAVDSSSARPVAYRNLSVSVHVFRRLAMSSGQLGVGGFVLTSLRFPFRLLDFAYKDFPDVVLE